MKFCQHHWDELRAAIGARGLNHLIAANGRDSHARHVAELEGKAEVDDFDPLMSAYWMIANRAVAMGGLYLMTGDFCPICEALTNHPADCGDPECTPTRHERYWIDGPADEALRYAREHGLVSTTEEV